MLYYCTMRLFRNILSVFLLVIFLFSSTGLVVFHSFCSCSGYKQTTFYVLPETCNENYHKHHLHNWCGNEIETCQEKCHECSNHKSSCGCDKPDFRFSKLINQLQEKELRLKVLQPIDIQDYSLPLVSEVIFEEETGLPNLYDWPPPKFSRTFDFLIQIHQVKIPSA